MLTNTETIDREGLTNNRFSLLQNYIPITEDGNRFIKGNNFFNRMAGWRHKVVNYCIN